MPYREREALGEIVWSGVASPWGAAGGAVILFTGPVAVYFALDELSLQPVVSSVMMAGMGVLCGLESLRLMRLRLDVHEHGLRVADRGQTEAFLFRDIIRLEGRYVPGIRKRGVEDEGNLASIVIYHCDGRTVSLPKDLKSFPAIGEKLRARCDVPYTKVLIKNIAQR